MSTWLIVFILILLSPIWVPMGIILVTCIFGFISIIIVCILSAIFELFNV
jgi:hypothetical protein